MTAAPRIVTQPTGDDGNGYYIRTFTGKKFYWASIETNQFDISDIAHALANNCRWSGHVKEFYSVAQHSVYASREAPPGFELDALLHDAAEAYVHDTPSPLKWHLKDNGFTVFSDLENRIEKEIAKRFGVAHPMPPEVKEVDMRLLSTESRDLMPNGEERLHMVPPYDWKIQPLDPREAERMFLRRYNRLWLERKNEKAKIAA